MSKQNPYAPPTANVEDILETGLRTDYGLKLSASLYWRVLVLQTVIVVPVAIMITFFDLGEGTAFLLLKPTLFFVVAATVIASSTRVFRPGLLFLVWGHRLRLQPSGWSRLSWSLFGFYLLLGVANICVAIAAPLAVWVQYKTYAPFLATIAFCAVAPRFLPRPNPSIEGTFQRPLRALWPAPHVKR